MLVTEMEKAKLLAENIKGFKDYVLRSYQDKNVYLSDPEKLFRLKLLVEEYKLHIIADELFRINRFTWDEKVTYLLVNRFKKAITIIGEYIENNYEDLFIFTPRLSILVTSVNSFRKI